MNGQSDRVIVEATFKFTLRCHVLAVKTMAECGLDSGDIKIEVEKAPASFKSSVWQTFGFPVEYNDGKKTVKKDETVCRLCHLRIKYTGSTTNMSTHLRRHHPDIGCGKSRYSDSESKPLNIYDNNKRPSVVGQLRLTDAFKAKLSSRSTREQALTNGIGAFIAMDMRPYSVVENIGFKHLIHTLEPRYYIPSRTHFTNYVLPEMYKKVKSHVMKSISCASSMALTTDGWTSRAIESYVTITAHYVNDDWQLENPVLQTRTLHESHTGANLAYVLESAVEEWNLDKFSQTAISTDNASNIVSAVKRSRFAPHIRCFAHTMNIESQKAMQVPQMSGILGRVRRIVSFFHRSSHAASVLKSKQLLLELPCHKLIQDVSTRWNSSYEMLERYLEQQAAIFATLTVKDIRKNASTLVTLSDEDVSAVEDAVNVLRPLKTITTILCSEKVPTVSLILPLKELILKSMSVTESDSDLIKAVKSAIVKDLKTRYTEPDIKKFLPETTALDPRFRSLPYHDEAGRLLVYNALTVNAIKIAEANKEKVTPVRVKEEPSPPTHPVDEAMAQPPLPALPQANSQPPECPDSETHPETDETQTCAADSASDCETPGPSQLKKPKSAIEDIFGEVFITHVQEAKPLSASIGEEVQKYKIEECIPLTENPLLWWKTNAIRFPALARLVKQYLGVCATSVPSERVFSSAGDIVTAQRASLSAENVDVLIFLKKNMKL